MKFTPKRLLSLIPLAFVALGLTACGSYGEAHDHNAAPPVYDVHAQWVRVQSPGNYTGIIMTCVGKTALYILQDGDGFQVAQNSPDCSPTGQVLTPAYGDSSVNPNYAGQTPSGTIP